MIGDQPRGAVPIGQPSLQVSSQVSTRHRLNLALFNAFDVTMTANTTFEFIAAQQCSTFTLILRGAFTPTFPAGVIPTLAYATPSMYSFTTFDGGATWVGTQMYPAAAGGGNVATDVIWDAKGDLAAGTGADTAAKLTVGVNGTQLIADSNQSSGMKYVGSPAMKVPWTSSQCGVYGPETMTHVVASQAAATAQIPFWAPFWLPRKTTPNLICYCWTLESGATLRISTWANDEATFKPATGGLIEDVGTLSAASTGAKSITPATAIGPGWIWVGAWASNNTTVRWSKPSTISKSFMGDDSPADTRIVTGWISTAIDYSAGWSGTLPTLTAANTTNNPNAYCVLMEII